MVSLESSRQDESTDIQYDLLGSPHDIVLRSNFDLDLSRSSCMYMFRSALTRGTQWHANYLFNFLVQTLFEKNRFGKNSYFDLHGLWRLNFGFELKKTPTRFKICSRPIGYTFFFSFG